MKRALILSALFVVGLVTALTLAGGGLSWYSTSTQTETTGTTETTTTTETTATVLCPNGNPNTGGKDGLPGNDSCALDETTPQTTAPQLTISIGTTTATPAATTQETTTLSTTTTPTTTSSSTTPPPTTTTPAAVPPATPPTKAKPPCKNGTPRVNGRCHPIVRGSG